MISYIVHLLNEPRRTENGHEGDIKLHAQSATLSCHAQWEDASIFVKCIPQSIVTELQSLGASQNDGQKETHTGMAWVSSFPIKHRKVADPLPHGDPVSLQ